MPSNTTQLPESEDTEPDLPVPVQNLRRFSVFQDESLSEPRDVSHLGAVLDLQPLCEPRSEENTISSISTHEREELGIRTRASELSGLSQDGLDWRMMRMMMMMEEDEGERCVLNTRRKSVNTTECVLVPTSEHVAEIVGRQGCKIKALRAKTNTYIKTPVRGEEPMFVVTGRKEDVAMAKREILSAAEHFSLIRASRNKVVSGNGLNSVPCHPGQTTIQVRVPYRMVGLVVGPKGATIKRIQQQTHTYIVTPSREKEPVFEVTGMPENVDRAREEIEAHIALRTAGSVDSSADDDDFHYNGKDVGFELGRNGVWLSNNSAASVNNSNLQVNSGSYRNDSSSSLGSNSSESFYSSGGMADLSPGSGGCTFWFGDTQLPLGSDDSAGSTNKTTWSAVERGGASLPTTPRLSPSLLTRLSPSLSEALDHPLVRLVPENSQSLPAFGPVFSPSSDSAGSGSPPDTRSYTKHSQVLGCLRCGGGDSVAALVLGGQNLLCPECSKSIQQST